MNLLGRIASGLHDHWFRPARLSDLALVRIVVVSFQLLYFYPSLQAQFVRAAYPDQEFSPLPALKVLLLPLGEWGIRPDPTLIHAVWVGGIVFGVAALLGKYSNLSVFCFAVATTFLEAHRFSYGFVHHPQAPVVIILWALAFSPCGRRWSLDSLQWRLRFARESGELRRLDRDERDPFARWPLRTGQWVLAIGYFSAGTHKLLDGGLDWFRSSTLAFYLVQDGVRWEMPLGLFFSTVPELLVPLAVFTILFETTFFLAILLPGIAWAYVVSGAALHVGILLTMRAGFLQWVLAYVCFLGELRDRFPGSWIRTRIGSPQLSTVIIDGRCPLCVRTAVVLDYVDVRSSLSLIDLESRWEEVEEVAPGLDREEAVHRMHLVTPEGRIFGGFFAFRELARTLPLLWPLFPVFRAPLADRVGPKIYNWIAERRRDSPCGVEGCRVTPADAVTSGSLGA